MRCWIAAHSSWVWLSLISVMPLSACGGSPPTPEPSAPSAAQTGSPSVETPAAPSPLASATPAPGSERLSPDEHPELAHLTQVTTESLTQSITAYVRAEAARQGGVYSVHDPHQQAALGLTLLTVHRERLSQLADGRYFACADFKGRDGHTYDVDIFMRAESTGLKPADVIVHKQNGTARFNWMEQNGAWWPVPVATR